MRTWFDLKKKIMGLSVSLPLQKGIEVEAYYDERPYKLVHGSLSYSNRTDHAGLDLKLGLFAFRFEAKLYDGRHWNETESRWYRAGEEQKNADDDKEIQKELTAFFLNPENLQVIGEKFINYFKFVSIDDRARFHEFFVMENDDGELEIDVIETREAESCPT